MRKSLKTIVFSSIATLAIVIVIFVLSGTGTILYNNRDVSPPNNKQLNEAYDAAVIWLQNNETEILRVMNPMLWYFIQRTAETSNDKRIEKLYKLFYERNITPAKIKHRSYLNLWVPLFVKDHNTLPRQYRDVSFLVDYEQHFVYAIACDIVLGNHAKIKAQNSPDYCGKNYFLNPTCTTHQLMGIRFMQRSKCGDAIKVSNSVDALQSKIVNELTYDPRVVDVYIQRVLMLIESGRRDLVKNIWIQRVLDSQLDDGGWGNFQPVIPVSSSRYIGFGHGDSRTGQPRAGNKIIKGISIGQPRSTFHATAQGVLLLALLLNEPG